MNHLDSQCELFYFFIYLSRFSDNFQCKGHKISVFLITLPASRDHVESHERTRRRRDTPRRTPRSQRPRKRRGWPPRLRLRLRHGPIRQTVLTRVQSRNCHPFLTCRPCRIPPWWRHPRGVRGWKGSATCKILLSPSAVSRMNYYRSLHATSSNYISLNAVDPYCDRTYSVECAITISTIVSKEIMHDCRGNQSVRAYRITV